MWNDYAREILAQKLKESRERNPSFSLRAYAKKVDMGVGTLSDFLAGKRKLSKEAAKKILAKFEFSDSEKKRLSHLFEEPMSRQSLCEEKFALISKWQYFAILSMFELEFPPTDAGEVATKIGLPTETVEAALETLANLNLLSKVDDWYKISGVHLSSSDEIPSGAIVASHLGDFEKAKEALQEVPLEERDFVSITFAGDASQIKKAKEEIRKFRANLCLLMSAPKLNQVYKMSIQLYPLLKNGEH